MQYGRIFRSQGLHALTDEDVRKLLNLKLQLVCDLRSARERRLHPGSWFVKCNARLLHFDIRADVRAANRALLDIVRKDPTERGAREMMIASYATFPKTFAEALKTIWQAILPDRVDERLPVLVHCSAGKDRTGFVMAMMLSALGVSRDDIISDYMQTRTFMVGNQPHNIAAESIGALLGFVPPPEALSVISSVTPQFLHASFAAIERDHGTVDRYLSDACGLTVANRERFRGAVAE
jgi:protein-tyrosine phosphatase